jgi:hypothetical protein
VCCFELTELFPAWDWKLIGGIGARQAAGFGPRRHDEILEELLARA